MEAWARAEAPLAQLRGAWWQVPRGIIVLLVHTQPCLLLSGHDSYGIPRGAQAMLTRASSPKRGATSAADDWRSSEIAPTFKFKTK